MVMPMGLPIPILITYVILTALIPGLLATWLGVGGCFLRIPMLMFLFNLPIKVAYCVNQAVVALTTIPGVLVHIRERHVYTKGFIVASLSAMAGVALGAYVVAKYLPSQVLKVFFGAVCVGIGIYVSYRTLKLRKKLTVRKVVTPKMVLEAGPKLSVLMFIAGFATGICGFGGGIYFVPVYLGLGYPTHVAIGTSSTQMILVAGLGSTVLTINGFMNVLMLLLIGIPTLLASWIGAKLAAKSPPWILRLIYGLAIIAAGLYVSINALSSLIV